MTETVVRRRRPLPGLPTTPPIDNPGRGASPVLDAHGHGHATAPATTPQFERAQWNSRMGFVLSAIGSAVGFGSIARFPMNAANNGGAAFVLLYAGIMLLVGIPLMIAEFSLGRSAQRNTVGTFVTLQNNARTRWRHAGLLYVLVAAFFLSWYAAVSGWVLRYAFASPTGAYFSAPGAYFLEASEGPDALFWHFGVMLLTLAAVTGKISKGIEKLNLVLMPTLFVSIVGLAIYAATLDGASAGYTFYLQPEFGALTLGVVIAAVGQAFFSLSLGQGAMMTYASYLPRDQSLASNALVIAGSTLVFALTCGFMIFPMLSAFGLLGTEQAGLGLIFGPLSLAFASMGSPTGQIVGTLFFSVTFFAAFTSAVSLTEPAIAYVTEEWRAPRWKSALLVVLVIYSAGIPVALSTDLLNLEGGKITDVAVILGGLLIALYVGWVAPRRLSRERMDSGEGLRLARFAFPIVRWVMPAVLVALLVFAILGTPCALSGGAAGPGLLDELFGLRALSCPA